MGIEFLFIVKFDLSFNFSFELSQSFLVNGAVRWLALDSLTEFRVQLIGHLFFLGWLANPIFAKKQWFVPKRRLNSNLDALLQFLFVLMKPYTEVRRLTEKFLAVSLEFRLNLVISIHFFPILAMSLDQNLVEDFVNHLL